MVRSLVHVRYVDDPEAWDALVVRCGGRLLQSWRWGSFKARHGWHAIRLALQNGAGVAVAQVLLRRSYGVSVMYIPRGPVADVPSTDLARGFRSAIDQLAQQERAIAVIAEPEDERGLELLPSSLGWRPTPTVIQPRRTLRIRLGDDQQLLSQMKPKTRYNVRLAFRRGITTRHGSIEEIPAFYSLLRETAQRDGFGIHRLHYFRDLLHVFGDDAVLLFAE
ncbi:MAG: aminoacyltransferase, partial [Thermomicrobium sp.]|nr:aminoacyltransferase [Thermomicrobium sp.]